MNAGFMISVIDRSVSSWSPNRLAGELQLQPPRPYRFVDPGRAATIAVRIIQAILRTPMIR
jgi:hypothetical protein